MPNYARQSALDLDEIYGSYVKNESIVAMMRNIRTKEKMHSAHHCEDKECGGSPSMRCVSALHFCWCLAPIVDKDRKSDTYGQVVVCGQRFQCISPKGCAKHPYLKGFNIDIRDARNGYPTTEIKWKLIFEVFKTEYDAALADNAERQELSREWEGMTGHQKRRQRKLQDQAAFQRRRERERAAGRLETKELPLRDDEISLAGDGEIDDRRPTTHVSDVSPSAKPTLRTRPIATLLLTKDSELLSAPTDTDEVADQQAPIKIPATRLHRKVTKTQGVEVASEPDEKDDMTPRVRDGVKGSNAGISVKVGLRNKTGGYACV